MAANNEKPPDSIFLSFMKTLNNLTTIVSESYKEENLKQNSKANQKKTSQPNKEGKKQSKQKKTTQQPVSTVQNSPKDKVPIQKNNSQQAGKKQQHPANINPNIKQFNTKNPPVAKDPSSHQSNSKNFPNPRNLQQSPRGKGFPIPFQPTSQCQNPGKSQQFPHDKSFPRPFHPASQFSNQGNSNSQQFVPVQNCQKSFQPRFQFAGNQRFPQQRNMTNSQSYPRASGSQDNSMNSQRDNKARGSQENISTNYQRYRPNKDRGSQENTSNYQRYNKDRGSQENISTNYQRYNKDRGSQENTSNYQRYNGRGSQENISTNQRYNNSQPFTININLPKPLSPETNYAAPILEIHARREQRFANQISESHPEHQKKFDKQISELHARREPKFNNQMSELHARPEPKFDNKRSELYNCQEAKFDSHKSELHAQSETKSDQISESGLSPLQLQRDEKFPTNMKNYASRENLIRNKLIKDDSDGCELTKNNEPSNLKSDIIQTGDELSVKQSQSKSEKCKKLKAQKKLVLKAKNNNTLDMKVPESQHCQLIISTPHGSADMVEKFVKFKLPQFEFELESLPGGVTKEAKVCLKFGSLAQAKKAFKVLQKLNDNAFKVELIKEKNQNVKENLTENPFEQQLKMAEEMLNQHIQNLTKLSSGNQMEEINFTDFTSKQLPLMNRKLEMENQKREFENFLNKMKKKTQMLTQSSPIAIKRQIQKLFIHEFTKFKNPLPIYSQRRQIIDALNKSQVCIITGEIGSGKSTEVVQYIHNEEICGNGIIAFSQPRDISVICFAEQISKDFGNMVGQLVGYRIGMESKINSSTKILVVNEDVLLNEFQSDSDFTTYSCIVIDQVSERNLTTDLLLAALKSCLIKRNDLKVIILAYSSDVTMLEHYFKSCVVIKIPERHVPMEIQYELKEDSKLSSVDKAIECVSKIVKDSPLHENIFVFLSTISEVEEAYFMLKTALPVSHENTYVSLRLYDQLQLSEWKLLFRENKGRKIIFAVKFSELLQILPNVYHVIDTGLEEEITYDAMSKTNSVQIKLANKISAEYRTIKNGCENTKKCYLLYTKEQYNKMDKSLQPEILRTDLTQVILKMRLQTKDILQSQFLSPINENDLKLAIKHLQEMEALSETEEYTPLGEKMVQLSLEPLLSKMVLTSIEQDIGLEAIVVAAVMSLSGKALLSWDFKQVDSSLLSPFGDHFTVLNMYKMWKTNESKKDTINNRFLNILDQVIIKIFTDINQLQLTIPLIWQDDDEYQNQLCQILLICYSHNLCKYSGKALAYMHCQSKNIVHLLSNSTLDCLNQKTPFVIYNTLLKNSANYMLNVTAVEEIWFKVNTIDIKGNVDKTLTLKSLEERSPITITGISKYIMKQGFIGEGGSKTREIEEMIASKCHSKTEVKVQTNLDEGTIVIFAADIDRSTAKSIIDDAVLLEREILQMMDEECFYPNKSSQLRIIFGSGASVSNVLQPFECRSIVVTKIDEQWKTKNVSKFMRQFGKVESYKEEMADNKRTVTITFKNPQDAVKSLDSPGRNQLFNWTLNSQKLITPSSPEPYFINISWLRRNVFADIKFRAEDFSKIIANYVPEVKILGGSIKTSISLYSVDTITLTKLPFELSAESIKRLFYPEPINVMFYSETPFQTSEKAKQVIVETVKKMINHYQCVNCEVDLNKSNDYDKNYLLSINFKDKIEGRVLTLKMIQNRDVIEGKRLTIKPQFRDMFICAVELYDYMKKFDELITRFNEVKSGFFSVEFEPEKNSNNPKKNIIIKIVTDNMIDLLKLRYILLQELTGDILECDRSNQLQYLLSKEGIAFLKRTEESLGIYFNINSPRRFIAIHGPVNLRFQGQAVIFRFLHEKFNTGVIRREIPIQGDGVPKGFLKELFKRFGNYLEDLVNIPGIIDLKLGANYNSLELFGSDVSVIRIDNIVTALMKELIVNENASLPSSKEILCSLCAASTDENMYEMSICGHGYCVQCIRFYIRMEQLPLKCVQSGCSSELSLMDLKLLLHRNHLNKLNKAAIIKYVEDNPNKVAFCPTVNCSSIYCITAEETVFECSQCSAKVCTSCKTYSHSGITCSVYLLNKEIIQKEAERNGGFQKYCPECKRNIQKDDTSEWVLCKFCNTLSCWWCKSIFKSEYEAEIHCYNCEIELQQRFGDV